MAQVNPYINFGGNCKEAFDFYKSVLGGEFATEMKFGDAPPSDHVDASENDLIMHVALPLSNGSILMGSDRPKAMGTNVTGNNFAVSLSTDSKEEADKFFNGLSEGGQVTMPIADTFWGSYFGMLTDKFGINWMIDCHPAQQ